MEFCRVGQLSLFFHERQIVLADPGQNFRIYRFGAFDTVGSGSGTGSLIPAAFHRPESGIELPHHPRHDLPDSYCNVVEVNDE